MAAHTTKNMKELFESYSNLSYNAAGFVALIWFDDVLFCFALQALGIGSFIYHYNKSPDRNHNVIWKFDWWAMAAINTIVAGIHFDNKWVWLALFSWHLIYSLWVMGKLHVFAEVAMSAVPAFVGIFLHRSLLTFGIILGLFLIALLIRSKDEDPKQHKFHDSVAHSIWHILTAPMFLMAIYLDV